MLPGYSEAFSKRLVHHWSNGNSITNINCRLLAVQQLKNGQLHSKTIELFRGKNPKNERLHDFLQAMTDRSI